MSVRVIPGARKNMTREEGELLKVYLTAPPQRGKANKALVELLARHFGVKKTDIRIVKGMNSRTKILEIREV